MAKEKAKHPTTSKKCSKKGCTKGMEVSTIVIKNGKKKTTFTCPQCMQTDVQTVDV